MHFSIGKHSISAHISEDNKIDYFQYEYHAGYEVVEISTFAHSKYKNDFCGGVLLYKNITPAKCIRENNAYTSFGIPLNIQNKKQKSIK